MFRIHHPPGPLRHSDRARGDDPRLRPRAHVPRRPAERGGAARRAGRDGAGPQEGVRVRQAAPHPVRDLARADPDRRPRGLRRPRARGRGRGFGSRCPTPSSSPSGEPSSGSPWAPSSAGSPATSRDGGSTRSRPRSRSPGSASRTTGLGVAPRHHLLGRDERAAVVRDGAGRLDRVAVGRRAPAPPRAAGRHPRGDPDGPHHPDGARDGGGDPQPGVRPGPAREGPPPPPGPLARGAQRRPDHPRGHGPSARLPARRLDPGRDGVPVAGHRLAPQQRDLRARPCPSSRGRSSCSQCSSCS